MRKTAAAIKATAAINPDSQKKRPRKASVNPLDISFPSGSTNLARSQRLPAYQYRSPKASADADRRSDLENLKKPKRIPWLAT
jgi:hypothetical protein